MIIVTGFKIRLTKNVTYTLILGLLIQSNTSAQNVDIEGEIDIAKTGVALRINGDEAIWYNDTYFSYGFGASHNYMAKPLRIGPFEGSSVPFADLHLVDDDLANLSIESHNSDAVLQFTDNGSSSTDDWTIRRESSNGAMQWRHNTSKLLTLNTKGDLGLGVTNPAYKFDMEGIFNQSFSINGDDNYVGNFSNNSNNNNFRNNGISIIAGHDDFEVTRQSSLIHLTRPDGIVLGCVFQVSSNSVFYANSSDMRLKKGIEETHHGLNEILNIKVRDYYWKDDVSQSNLQVGFLAQELYEIFPQAVVKGGDDESQEPWMVSKTELVPLLVKGMQEQQERINYLLERDNLLKSRIDDQDAIIAQLKTLIETTSNTKME